MGSIQDQNFQNQSKQLVHGRRGGGHRGAIDIASVGGIAVNELPAQQQHSPDELAVETIQSVSGSPVGESAGHAFLAAQILGARFAPELTMEERIRVDAVEQRVGGGDPAAEPSVPPAPAGPDSVPCEFLGAPSGLINSIELCKYLVLM